MERPCSVLVLMALSATIVGCVRHSFDEWWPEPTELTQGMPVFMPDVGLAPEPAQSGVRVFQEPTGTLALRDAIALALVQSPDLASFAWEIRAAEARVLQASLLPNPEVGVELENIGGSGAISGFEGVESTISLSQVFLFGGKLGKRTKIARFEWDLASWDYEIQRIDVLVNTTKRFIDVLAAQRRLALANDASVLAAQVHDGVSSLVDVGAVSPTEQIRTGVLVSTSRLSFQRAERVLQVARYRLAGTWGSTAPVFGVVAGQLEEVSRIPSVESLVHRVSENPRVTRWVAEISRSRAVAELAEAEGVPDVEVGAGWRHFNETDDTAFVIDFSLPLPVFDRNQGGVLEARYNLAKAEQERRSAAIHVQTTLVAAHQELVAAYSEAIALSREVIPAARRGFEFIDTAYREGKVGYLEVLDAQRTLIDVQTQYIEALAAYHRGVAELEGLVGQSLSTVTDNSQHESKGINP